jgi:ABC-2 type transport system permease protein
MYPMSTPDLGNSALVSAGVDVTSGREVSVSLDVAGEGRVFWQLRRRLIGASLRDVLAQSRLRTALIVVLSASFWLGLYALFFEGFAFLHDRIPGDLLVQTIQAVYNVFFMSLAVMLTLSSGIILYGGLYRSDETSLLLTLPARTDRVFLHKFQAAVAMSSWGFLLLASPMLVAYGFVVGSPWYYFVLIVPFIVGFAFIPCSVGAILCLLIARFLPLMRSYVVALFALVLIGSVVWGVWSLANIAQDGVLSSAWLREFLTRLQYSQHWLMPHWWLSNGLLEAARTHRYGAADQPAAESIKLLCVIVANALLLHQVAVWTSTRVFRSGYSGLMTEVGRRRKYVVWPERFVAALIFFYPRQIRLLLIKDVRLFRRDPVQWSQFLIFFGLLGLYFLNIRRFRYDTNHSDQYAIMVSNLNLAVVGLILSTFTTRFIFPMISLEGRRFWILGLLPVARGQILWGKFFFAASGSSLACCALVAASDVMLRIDSLVFFVHQVAGLVLCVGLSGIAVGLGATLPDMREQSPAKIAAGFGGTLNLIVSAAYIAVVVAATAIPTYRYVDAIGGGPLRLDSHPDKWFFWLIASTIANAVLGIVAALLPMWIGLRAFRRMEF